MYKNDKVIRRYSEPFKLKILAELTTGKPNKSQLGTLYGINPTIINDLFHFAATLNDSRSYLKPLVNEWFFISKNQRQLIEYQWKGLVLLSKYRYDYCD